MLDSEWFVRDFRACVVMVMLTISFFSYAGLPNIFTPS